MCLPFRPVSKTHSFSSSSSTIATRMINCILLFAFIFLVYLLISASRLQSKTSIHAYFSSSDQDQSKSLTKINHIVFGLGSSTNSWPARREYVKLWWDAQKMRGCVFVDHPLSSSENHTDSDLLPPICISQDTSRFRYTWRGGDRNAIRIARCVLETVRLFNASSEEVRWYVFGDDDTIFIPENLARTLIDSRHLLLPNALRTQETFRPWGQSGYTFNTREIHPDPCQRPVTFYMQHVSSSRHNGTIESVYTQAYENCTYDPITSPRKIQEIRVFSKRLDLDIRQLKAPRRQCCEILPTSSTGGKVMEIGLRECKEDELIYMHP
ncbi:PREDICTED: uncharacterized protein LOC104763147 [Camelina sativa]|uniref:Uncharacterized protein LOC104763147 n=1 Tax=Camelina sativa TaxID=90675 RepID=A0ABM1R7L8_CAMSA|nr:PREDICTED: uncharacterized protein LOC104763147 [Camelina sativa]